MAASARAIKIILAISSPRRFPVLNWRGPPPKRPRRILKLVSHWLHARIDRAFYLTESDRPREIVKAAVKKRSL